MLSGTAKVGPSEDLLRIIAELGGTFFAAGPCVFRRQHKGGELLKLAFQRPLIGKIAHLGCLQEALGPAGQSCLGEVEDILLGVPTRDYDAETSFVQNFEAAGVG